jgi:hypothetical protein
VLGHIFDADLDVVAENLDRLWLDAESPQKSGEDRDYG